MKTCQLCQKVWNSNLSLSKHLRATHDYSMKQYYVKFLGRLGTCVRCGRPTYFLGLDEGFTQTCSKSCGEHKLMERLKANPVAWNEYQTKQAAMWSLENPARSAWHTKLTTVGNDDTRYTPFGFIDTGIDTELPLENF